MFRKVIIATNDKPVIVQNIYNDFKNAVIYDRKKQYTVIKNTFRKTVISTDKHKKTKSILNYFRNVVIPKKVQNIYKAIKNDFRKVVISTVKRSNMVSTVYKYGSAIMSKPVYRSFGRVYLRNMPISFTYGYGRQYGRYYGRT